MRHQYTPIFREFTTSSMWAKSCEERCVWLWMLLNADPEGFVPGTIPGLAIAANVELKETRKAIAAFMAPDPDSNTQTNKGRRLEKVPHGWRILNFEYWRELAKHEAEKARKRKWANANGKRPPAANDNAAPKPLAPSSNLDASSETLDAPKPKPKSDLFSEEEIPPTPQAPPPPPPVASQQSRHGVLTELPDDYVPSEALRMAATLAGVKRLDHWIAKLKMKPIGGQSGIRADKLEPWLIGLVAEWRKWEETDSFKDGNSRSGAGSGSRFQGGQAPSPTARRERVQGAPDWVYVEHDKFARREGLNLNRAARAFEKGYHLPVKSLHGTDLFTPFMKYLENLASSKEASA
jgi:hypothetical protein